MDESIWFGQPDIEAFNQSRVNTACEALDIRLTDVGRDYLVATMPVDHRTVQFMGILHGGASVLLAETLGSLRAYLTIDPERFVCMGQEVNASHFRGVCEGSVTARAQVLHMGRTSQVWDIMIVDDAKRRVCSARLTVAIRPHRKQ